MKNLTIALVILLAGCVSVPKEAPELSARLGKHISSIEQSHISLLNRYFDEKRLEVDRFINEDWLPVFADTFFSKPGISSVWDEVVKSKSKSERLQFILRSGPDLQAAINAQRLAMHAPLNSIEAKIKQNIEKE